MPERPLQPTVPRWFNEILERLRAVERISFKIPEQPEPPKGVSAYSWQSSQVLTVGFGHKLHADRDGVIAYIRAERSSADGTGTATFEVYLNGDPLFATSTNPTVGAGDALGPERIPPKKTFDKGDSFQVEILDTGGGTGPLRVTIRYDPVIAEPASELEDHE